MPTGYTGTATDEGEIEAAICLDAFYRNSKKVEVLCQISKQHYSRIVFLVFCSLLS